MKGRVDESFTEREIESEVYEVEAFRVGRSSIVPAAVHQVNAKQLALATVDCSSNSFNETAMTLYYSLAGYYLITNCEKMASA